MLYSITCSTKILTLAIAPFLFILAEVLCKFVNFILPFGRRGTLFFLRAQMYIHIQQHIHQKDLNLCLTSYNYAKVIDELEKTKTRNSAVLWSL